jgi:glycosyltransferase involved in cell wall biosynthesis/2-polyprenyl-3-methyl-5-hydroxy-6-metoxy-1,4-benzoquinol methylase
LKILTILTYYRPHWTGLTQHAANIAEGLVGRGHAVTVLAIRHHPTLVREEVVEGVRVIRLPPIARFSRGFIAPTFPRAARDLIREHDIVHIHTPLPESLLVAWLCRRARRPLVMTHQGDLVMPAGAANQLIEWVGKTTMRRTGRLATGITTLSRDYAEHSEFLSPFLEKVNCIHPPVRLPDPERTAAIAWRRALGLEDRTLVGFAGRFVEEKGFDYLLRAIPMLAALESSVHLVHAGERQLAYERFYDKCRPLVDSHPDRLTFLGLLEDRRQLANFYAMCDVVAVPSRTDCFASVQVEAMFCGTPVVCSDIPGSREVVTVTGGGVLVEPRSPEALADGVAHVLREREQYGRRALTAREHFDPERSIDEHERVLVAAARETTPFRGDRLSRHGNLTSRDLLTLDGILANEADMAFHRRTRILLDYLELRDGERVLDCGCGMGFHLMAMQKLHDLRLVGLDPDPARLARAEQEGATADLVVGEAERLPFEHGSFDKILMTEVLEHLDDDQAALHEVARVLRPGGVLAISVPNARYPFLWDPISAVRRIFGRPPLVRGPIVGIWTNHRRLYTAESLVERVRAAGLDVELVEEVTHYSVPFQHFLVYGIGKPLFERGLLPGRLRHSADRFAGEANTGSLLDPFNMGRAAFRLVDRLNDLPRAARKRTHVNVLIKARKPTTHRRLLERLDKDALGCAGSSPD